jgi:hypothetical protein
LYAITKAEQGAQLLRTVLPLADGGFFDVVGTDEDMPGLSGTIVAADATMDGGTIGVKVKGEGVRLWSRAPGQTVANAMAGPWCTGPGADGQDRALALESGGIGYLLVGQQENGDSRLSAVRQSVACPSYGEVERTGRLEAQSAVELSGIAASRQQPGVLWSHNDRGSGDDRVSLIAFDDSGHHFGDAALSNAVNEDWEDIAIAPAQPGGPDFIYIGDIGDNDLRRDTIRIIRLPEPDIDTFDEAGQAVVGAHEEFELRYADAEAHDAESLAIDPVTGQVLVVTKRNDEDRKTKVFMTRAPLGDDGDNVLEPVISEKDADGLNHRFVAADIAPDGSALIAQIDDGLSVLWPRYPSESWSQALSWPPCTYEAPDLQLEAIAFDPRGGYVMVPEGERPRILRADVR